MQVSFVADEAFYRDGLLTFRGVRVDFTPSETPHEDLLAVSTEVEPPVQVQKAEVPSDKVSIVEQVSIVDEVLDEDFQDDTCEDFQDDGEVAPMDLSD